MKTLNNYKHFLIMSIMSKTNSTSSDAMKAVEEFIVTKEGVHGFHQWQIVQEIDEPKEKKPIHVGRQAWEIFDSIDPIAKQES